jgi:hypothetical protein
VGASGAIAGIMGLSAVCFIYTKVRVWYIAGYLIHWRAGTTLVPAPIFMGLWVSWEAVQGLVSTYTQAAFGFLPGTAHWTHVGGFAAGLAGALLFGIRKRVKRTDLLSGQQAITDSFKALSHVGELERVVKRSPDDADAWYALGRTWEINGRVEEARRAYTEALTLFLRRRRMKDTLRAYRALGAYGGLIGCPTDVQMELARAYEQAKRPREAYDLFRLVGQCAPGETQAEIALFRAGEIARNSLRDANKAAECFRSLLEYYPNSHWRTLCLERLRQLGVE